MGKKVKSENKVETTNDNQTTEVSKNGLTSVQKEIIITIVVLILTVIVGYFAGKYLFEMLNGPIH